MRSRRKTPEEAKAVVLNLASRHHRPILIGEVSVMLGTWSLEETEQLINEMVEDGDLRKINAKEAWKFGRETGYLRRKDRK